MLFINACVRKNSRTKRLADAVIAKMAASVSKDTTPATKSAVPVAEVRLWEQSFPVVDEAFLAKRDSLIYSGRFDDPMFDLARQFAEAEEIVIAAPFWDLSFPAALKQYIEQINVVGVTFIYTDEGIPKGLCKAEKLTFVTTAGGGFFPEEYGFGYIKSLAENFYGIKTVELVRVAGLDIVGNDADEIIDAKIKEING